MPSFISSFNRVPTTPAVRSLALAFVTVVLIVGGYEILLRYFGVQSSYPLSNNRWAHQMERGLNSAIPTTTLLLGASRIRGGFSSIAFSERYPQVPLYYLATSGESSMATLLFLADQTDFSGNVIISFHESNLSPTNFLDQQHLVEFYLKEWNLNHKINHLLGDLAAGNLVFRQSDYSLASVLSQIGIVPGPNWRRHSDAGESDYQFSLLDRKRLQEWWPQELFKKSHESLEPWLDNVRVIGRAASRIYARGGRVVFVRFPTSGILWKNDQILFPRHLFWDALLREPHITGLHFSDHPGLAEFNLPDQSHLDAADKDLFTNRLLDLLSEKKLLNLQ